MARRSPGVSGVAVLFVSAGVWLAYAGIRDVPVVDGLRSALRGEKPSGAASPLAGMAKVGGVIAPKDAGDASGGTLGLTGNALVALPTIRAAAQGAEIGGRADRPNNPSSDHPKGLAMDIMTRDPQIAAGVIAAFKTTRGAKYWIWNGRLGHVTRLWFSYPYTKFGGHYDHVHLSWF